MIRKTPGPKASDKQKKTMLANRKYKVRVLAQPVPMTPTAPVNSTVPAPTIATTSTPMPVTRSTATFIPVTVCKLVTEQFAEVPYPTHRPQNEGHPPIQNSNPPPLEDIPSAPVRQDTPWPNTGSALENLFETRKDWLIPPTPVPTSASTIKTEAPLQEAAIPHVMVRPKQAVEGCSWGLHCPISKNEEEHEEDWKGNMQRATKDVPTKYSAPPATKDSVPPAPNM